MILFIPLSLVPSAAFPLFFPLLSFLILALQPLFFASLIFFAALLSALLDCLETPTGIGFCNGQGEGSAVELALWMVSSRCTGQRLEPDEVWRWWLGALMLMRRENDAEGGAYGREEGT
jgi:hypothetical protein